MPDHVYVDIRKLRDYCLNPNHPIGKHKAHIFKVELSLNRSDAEELKESIIEEMKNAELQTEFEDEYGKRFSAEINVRMKQKEAVIKTIWILKRNEEYLSFVTCYVIN